MPQVFIENEQKSKQKELTRKVLCNARNYPAEALRTRNDIVKANMSANYQDILLFKQNAQYIIHQKGMSVRKFFRILTASGLNFSLDAFKKKKPEDQRPVNFLYFSSFANILCVPMWLLFSDDIERDWSRYVRQHPKDWNRVLLVAA